MKVVKYFLIIVILISLPRLVFYPVKAYWYQKEGKSFLSIPRVAIPLFKKSIEIYPHSWKSHFMLGHAFSKIKEYKRAKDEYLLTLKYNPYYARAHYNLGNAYFYLDHYDNAIVHYKKCLKIENTFKLAKDNLEVMYKLKGGI